MPAEPKPLSQNLVKKLKSLQQKKNRDKEHGYIAEGIRLCEEALGSSRIHYGVITTDVLDSPRGKTLVGRLQKQNIPIYKATASQFKNISDTKTPQGIALVIQKPPFSEPDPLTSPCLALDHIRDPGNLGTLLRSANWFGVKDIYVSTESVDPYNPKVVRSSMGSLFHCRIHENMELPSLLNTLGQKDYRCIGASTNGVDIRTVSSFEKDVIIIGSEAHGISQHLSNYIDIEVAIPGSGKGESLNAAIAGSIFLYHFTMRKKHDGQQ